MEIIEKIIEESASDQQDWLRKEIPFSWCDKVELLPRLMFAMLMHFVDEENGLAQLDMNWEYELERAHVDQAYIDKINTVYGELRDAYNYVKTERPQLQIDLDNSYPDSTVSDDWFTETKKEVNGIEFTVMKTCEQRFGASYEEVYKETNRLEELISEKDQWAMIIIVKYVGYLWT